MSIKKIWLWLNFLAFLFIGTVEASTLFWEQYVPEWTHGYVMLPATIGIPVVYQYIAVIIPAIICLDGLDVYLRNTYSPFVMGAGLPHPYSYSGVVKVLSNFVVVRGGGAKFPFPHEGNLAIINPATHAHRIGHDLIIEAEVTPGRPLDETPADLKSYIRSTRAGLWGTKQIASGYLSTDELQENCLIDHNKNNYSISDFIELFIENLKLYDVSFQIRDTESIGLTKKLGFLEGIGKNAFQKNDNAVKRFIFK